MHRTPVLLHMFALCCLASETHTLTAQIFNHTMKVHKLCIWDDLPRYMGRRLQRLFGMLGRIFWFLIIGMPWTWSWLTMCPFLLQISLNEEWREKHLPWLETLPLWWPLLMCRPYQRLQVTLDPPQIVEDSSGMNQMPCLRLRRIQGRRRREEAFPASFEISQCLANPK